MELPYSKHNQSSNLNIEVCIINIINISDHKQTNEYLKKILHINKKRKIVFCLYINAATNNKILLL